MEKIYLFQRIFTYWDLGCYHFFDKYSIQKYIYRHDPIPHTGRTGKSSAFRFPKTLNERKQNIYDHKFIRGKRRKLPTSWDDLLRQDFKKTQTWKHSKIKKQWMKK